VWIKWNPNRRRHDKEKVNILNIVQALEMELRNVTEDKGESNG
jgi:hypothetical protein